MCFCFFLFVCFSRASVNFFGGAVNFFWGTTPKRGIPALPEIKNPDRGCSHSREKCKPALLFFSPTRPHASEQRSPRRDIGANPRRRQIISMAACPRLVRTPRHTRRTRRRRRREAGCERASSGGATAARETRCERGGALPTSRRADPPVWSRVREPHVPCRRVGAAPAGITADAQTALRWAAASSSRLEFAVGRGGQPGQPVARVATPAEPRHALVL